MTIKAYQTLEDRGDIDYVENNGPFKCTRHDAWLGHGYYFWDTEIKWAFNWGKKSYKEKGSDYIIGECQLKIDSNCFDLVGNVSHQNAFAEVMEVFLEDEKSSSVNDKIVPNLITFMKRKNIFDYSAIRASDVNKPFKIYFTNRKKEFLILNPRVQICVINLRSVFLAPFKIVYPN